MLDMQKLANIINHNFSPEYGFPSDFVVAKVTHDGQLNFRIGNRDVDIDQTLKETGSGTELAGNWEISGEIYEGGNDNAK